MSWQNSEVGLTILLPPTTALRSALSVMMRLYTFILSSRYGPDRSVRQTPLYYDDGHLVHARGI